MRVHIIPHAPRDLGEVLQVARRLGKEVQIVPNHYEVYVTVTNVKLFKRLRDALRYCANVELAEQRRCGYRMSA